MGKTKKKSKSRNKLKKVIAEQTVQEVQPNPSPCVQSEVVQQFLVDAESHIESFNYDLSIESCQKVLNVDPRNVEAREMLAGIHVETGDWASAESLYLQCIELSPDKGYSKYLSLGQIYTGKQSIEFYEKGISLIEKLLENGETEQPNDASSQTPLNRVISEAFCSIADIFMTDCCDEENAEELCKAAICKSISYDSANPEAYQCLTDVHITNGNTEDAKLAITKSLSLWLPHYKTMQEENEMNSSQECSIPGYESRIKTCKLLIELNMWEEAIEVLDGLITENDEIVDVWYLKGYACALYGGSLKKSAGLYFQKAKEVALKVNDDTEHWKSHIDQLIKDLNIDSNCLSEESDCDDINQEDDEEIESSSED